MEYTVKTTERNSGKRVINVSLMFKRAMNNFEKLVYFQYNKDFDSQLLVNETKNIANQFMKLSSPKNRITGMAIYETLFNFVDYGVDCTFERFQEKFLELQEATK